jgi:hypothetical protein
VIQREHTLQAFAVKFFRAAIEGDHLFLSFDRAKPPGRSRQAQIGAMARQKARGVQRGTPDSLLALPGRAMIWIEWKDKGKRPDPTQMEMGQRLRALGHEWEWFDNIPDACRWLAGIGVTFRPAADTMALQYQGKVDAAIEKKSPRSATKKRVSQALSKAAVKRLKNAGVML